MGFLEALKRVLGDERPVSAPGDKQKLAAAWGLDAALVEGDSDDAEGTASGTVSAYDRRMWVKKLNFLLTERMPVEETEWQDFLADAQALGFSAAWIDKQLRSAFEQLLRKVVSDGVVTKVEHQQIEMARAQTRISEADAKAMLERVAREAKELLGRDVRGA